MRFHGTQVINKHVNLAPAAPISEVTMRPGLGSWIAALFIVVGAIVWAQNEQVVVWLLARDIVGEGVTRTLPGTLRWASVAVAILGLLAAWRLIAWSVLSTYHWDPIRTFASHIWAVLQLMAAPRLCTKSRC